MQNIYLLSFTTFLAGFIIAYFFVKSRTISRAKYEFLTEKFNKLGYDVGISNAVEKELRRSLEKSEMTLSKEKELNRSQDSLITELLVKGKYFEEKIMSEKSVNEKQQKTIEDHITQIRILASQLSEFKTLNANLQEKLTNQNTEFEESRKKSLVEFENIANKLFDEKTTKFSKESKANIEQLLNPLKQNLKEFKKQVEETYDKESKQRFSLEGKIKDLVDLNQQISKDATNLTKALKGQAKTQGDWGEMILENILEYSGLAKNREYFIQESFIDGDGKRKQPDVIIKYPDNRYIIVDSKVSLTAYERFANCEDIEAQKLYLAEHIKSLKNHIDNLSSKEYDKFDKTLDFVMLFVPIEPAFMTALHFDHELWSYAYKKRVLLISPTNLIAALKMVSDIWKREQQNNNALEIAKRGEMLYEKFVGFVGDMEDIDKHLGRVSDKYNDAMNKLSKGAGNLIRQAEMLKKLGINSKKKLPEKYLIEEIDDESVTE
jgi:DNA recombination protein RmuC